MGKLVLVAGGCRSGKSTFARKYVEDVAGERIFVATSPILDAETEERVRRHREERRDGGWETREEEVDIAEVVASSPLGASVLVDCLTLWVNNILYRAEIAGRLPGEDDAAREAEAFVRTCLVRSGLTVAVVNEVGLGIVPDNALARRFRDMAGRVNQTVAASADEVYFMVCGLPSRIK